MRDLTIPSTEEWEALCDGCGICCGFRPDHKIACPGLDRKTKRCTVYETRHDTYICLKVKPENVEELHAEGILPDSCGYVRYWQGKEPLDEVPSVKMIPFTSAPRALQRNYNGELKRYLLRREQ